MIERRMIVVALAEMYREYCSKDGHKNSYAGEKAADALKHFGLLGVKEDGTVRDDMIKSFIDYWDEA